jgi:hypothetical protein
MTAASAAALARGMPFKCRPDLERRGLVGRPFGSRTGEPTAFAVAKLGHVSFLPEVYLSIYRQLPSRLCLVSPWSGTGSATRLQRTGRSKVPRSASAFQATLPLTLGPEASDTAASAAHPAYPNAGGVNCSTGKAKAKGVKRTSEPRHIVRNNTCLVRRGRAL